MRHIRQSLAITMAVEYDATTNGDTKDENDIFASIGGNNEAKLALEEAVAADKQRRQLLETFGMSPPTGVLLYGPPGTGKTLLGKVIAKRLKSSSSRGGAFISISSTDVARAEIGNGEKLLVNAFESARSNAPAVVFIDEFQALFTDRSSGTGRLTSTLLTLMDDCGAWADLEDKARGGSITAQDKRVIVKHAVDGGQGFLEDWTL
mmetsp:Transcript_20460/g.26374  ORF Transcript_20460/g.26374 Transcript_20460/m.26374 type:complete len:206 (-) Transcript_20460:127-744(-)